MVDRLVEHIRNLDSSELGKSREPKAYLFHGHDKEMIVDEGRIFLPSEIVSQIIAENHYHGCGEVNPRAVFMTPINLSAVSYWCYSPSRILQIDDLSMSVEDCN